MNARWIPKDRRALLVALYQPALQLGSSFSYRADLADPIQSELATDKQVSFEMDNRDSICLLAS